MADTAATEGGSRLLALPAEMRNRIYRYTLVQSTRFDIALDNPLPKEPGLLAVCRQTRAEGMSIYLQENTFGFRLRGFDTTNLMHWCQLSLAHHYNSRITALKSRMVASPHNWRNLLRWLKTWHDGHLRFGIERTHLGTIEVKGWGVAHHVFDLMYAERCRPVEEIKKVLEAARKMVEVYDPRRANEG